MVVAAKPVHDARELMRKALSRRDAEILRRVSKGESKASVARLFGVSRERIRAIVARQGRI